MSSQELSKILEPGFWRHYKHDKTKGMSDHVYELVGIGHNTEYGKRPGEPEYLVLYRPLYPCSLHTDSNESNSPRFWSRPLDMWFEPIKKDGKMVPRFEKITDPGEIGYFEKIRDQMYPKS